VLRYFLLTAVYYIMAKDYKSIMQTVLLIKQYPHLKSNRDIFVLFRTIVVLLNELVVVLVIFTSDMTEGVGASNLI
jgi:hypothetical protein